MVFRVKLRVCCRLLFVYETFANAFGTVTPMKPFCRRCIQTLCLTVDVQILLKLVFGEHVQLNMFEMSSKHKDAFSFATVERTQQVRP